MPLRPPPARPGYRIRWPTYIQDHWHGRLPLVVSYWVSGAGGTLLSYLFAFGLPADYLLALHPRAGAAAETAREIFQLCFAVWQGVGIWRSAGAYIAAGKPRSWGLAARAVVGLNMIALAAALFLTFGPNMRLMLRIAAGTDVFGAYRIEASEDGRTLSLTGGLSFGVSRDLAAAIERHPEARVLRLNGVVRARCLALQPLFGRGARPGAGGRLEVHLKD